MHLCNVLIIISYSYPPLTMDVALISSAHLEARQLVALGRPRLMHQA